MKEPHSAHDTERLRSLLTRARPADGAAPDADRIAAHERRGRRRRVVLSLAARRAVAAFIITPQLLNKTRTTNLRNDLANRLAASSQSNGADPRTTTPCPADLVALPGDLAPGIVRADASSLRLCVAKTIGAAGASRGWPPGDALLLDSASAFLADVARLPEVPANHCEAVPSRPDRTCRPGPARTCCWWVTRTVRSSGSTSDQAAARSPWTAYVMTPPPCWPCSVRPSPPNPDSPARILPGAICHPGRAFA